jgi:hypothetical protein
MAGGILALFLIAFAIYVRSVPPYTPPVKVAPQPPVQGGLSAEQMARLQQQNIDIKSLSELLGNDDAKKEAGDGEKVEPVYTTPALEEALANARNVLKNIEVTKGTIKDDGDGASADETAETPEL